MFDIPELSNLKLRIPLSGSVALPLIGSLPAAGLTATDLKDGIRTRLQQQYMHDPQVSVFVQEHKSQRISVTGAVRRGGVFPLSSRLRLADALGMAEGLAEDAGFIVYVHRRVGTERVMTTVDLERLASGEDELNLQLQAGDVIEVPRAGSFYVGGEVQKPGSFMLKSRTTVEQAIVTAGGVRDVAKWDDVRLYRAGRDGHREIVKLSLDEFENGTPAPEVLKDDVIIVGKSHTKAFLYGVRDFLRFGMGATF